MRAHTHTYTVQKCHIFLCFITVYNEIKKLKVQGGMTSAVVKIWEQNHGQESEVDDSVLQDSAYGPAVNGVHHNKWQELLRNHHTE